MRERIGYYDVARGLGIIFVVIGHIDSFYEPVRLYVISFHMALFLIISGMLIRETGEDEKSLLSMIGKKFMRIMVPYFLFSVLSVAIEGIRLLTEGIFYWPHLRGLLITALTLQGNSVMWFLPALFLSEVFFLTIRKIIVLFGGGIKKVNAVTDVVTIAFILIFVGCVIWSNIFELAYYVGHEGIEKYERLHQVLSMLIRSAVCTFFVCAGYFVRKYIISLRISSYIWGIAAVILLALCGVMNYINPNVDLRALHWGDTTIWVKNFYTTLLVRGSMFLLGASAGAVGTVLLCKAFETFRQAKLLKILAFFGANSLIIMATHLDFHVMHYCMELSSFFNRLVNHSAFYHGCLLVLVFVAEAALIYVINRFCPVLVGKRRRKK